MSRTVLLLQCWVVAVICVTFTSAGCGLAQPTWRLDGRCGDSFPLANGEPSTCEKRSERPCCSDFGYCGNSDSHCTCEGCVDYRAIFQGCVRRFSGLQGVIESQDYPAAYPPNTECCYDIQRPDESYCGVKLYFDHFDLEGSMEPFCQQDWLTAEYCVPEKGARMCGNLTSTVQEFLYQPGSSALRLSFRSDAYNSQGGFHIRYELLQACRAPYANPMATAIPGTGGALCFTKVTNQKGTINTPYFPNNYPNEVDCVYEFERNNSLVCGVRMRSRVFELQEPFKSPFGGACTDFFHCPGCGYLCGSVEYTWVARFQPDATAIKFHFHSDEADTSKGFMATFEQIYDCD